MNPLQADIYRYAIPFTEPVTVRGVRQELREGLVFALSIPGQEEDGNGRTACGEIAPLPGLHDETLETAERELREFLPRLRLLRHANQAERKEIFSASGLSPSVMTGVEMAMMNLDALSGTPVPPLPAVAPAASAVPVNALLFGEPARVEERAEKLFLVGFRTFKLKIDAARLDNAVHGVRAFHRRFGNRAALRLDANQSLSLDEAVGFGKSVPEGSITFIEEPLRDSSLIPEFHAATGIRSALDESLWQRPELARELPVAALGAFVLKPNRLGGISATLALIDSARIRGLEAVLSSAFESGISLGLYARLTALSSPTPPSACGLDTARWLCHDLLKTAFSAEHGSIDPDAAYRNTFMPEWKHLNHVASWTL